LSFVLHLLMPFLNKWFFSLILINSFEYWSSFLEWWGYWWSWTYWKIISWFKSINVHRWYRIIWWSSITSIKFSTNITKSSLSFILSSHSYKDVCVYVQLSFSFTHTPLLVFFLLLCRWETKTNIHIDDFNSVPCRFF
jgi:hypothetical protein